MSPAFMITRASGLPVVLSAQSQWISSVIWKNHSTRSLRVDDRQDVLLGRRAHEAVLHDRGEARVPGHLRARQEAEQVERVHLVLEAGLRDAVRAASCGTSANARFTWRAARVGAQRQVVLQADAALGEFARPRDLPSCCCRACGRRASRFPAAPRTGSNPSLVQSSSIARRWPWRSARSGSSRAGRRPRPSSSRCSVPA